MKPSLQKIGSLESIGIVVGSIVGTGIFATPGMVAQFSTHLGITFILWGIGGLMCAFGGEIYGRFGQQFPRGGGQYIYLEKSLGKEIALVYGWMSLLVISPSMIASYGMFFGEQARHFFPFISETLVPFVAIAFISIVTTINYLGIRTTGNFEKCVVSAQVLLILALFITLSAFSPSAPVAPSALPTQISWATLSGAMVGILWSYEGFNSLSFIAHEIHDSHKKLLRYILWGCGIVFCLYFILNYLALTFISAEELVNVPNIGVPLAQKAFGERGSFITIGMMIIAVFMTTIPAIMLGPRVTHEMAIQGWLPARLATLHPRYTSPVLPLMIQFLLSSLFVFAGNFEWLISCFVTVSWCFYILVAVGFLVLTKKNEGRIYASTALKTGSFIVLAGFFLIIQARENPQLSAFGFAVLILSYIAVRYRSRRL